MGAMLVRMDTAHVKGSMYDGSGEFSVDGFNSGMMEIKQFFDSTYKAKTKMGTCRGASKDAKYVELELEPRIDQSLVASEDACAGFWDHTVKAINEKAVNGTITSPKDAQVKADYALGGNRCAPYTAVAKALEMLTGSKGIQPPGTKTPTNPAPKGTAAETMLQQLSQEFNALSA